MKNDREFNNFLKRVEAKGLGFFDDYGLEHVINSLNSIDINNKYHINSSYFSAIRNQVTWSQVEDQSIENETTLALQRALGKTFKSPVKNFNSHTMYDEKQIAIMEWDGILILDNKVFLCESKHKMTKVSIKKI